MSSKTASCAQYLLDACRTGDYKHFMECVTSGGVLYELDNGIARLLKKVSQATVHEIGSGVGTKTHTVDQLGTQGAAQGEE